MCYPTAQPLLVGKGKQIKILKYVLFHLVDLLDMFGDMNATLSSLDVLFLSLRYIFPLNAVPGRMMKMVI